MDWFLISSRVKGFLTNSCFLEDILLAAERTGNMLCLAAIKITAADLNYAWPSSYLLFLKCQACEGKHEMSLWLIASLMLLFY